MTDNKKNKQAQEEKKIPVFTVLKNGRILKNIYLLDSPPSISEEPKSIEFTENGLKSWEEILVVGRHPDSNIMLEHPSISRSHLRICSQPSSQKLSVMDLSSAHGTWVSGQKIEPQVVVELTEGDTLRLGASTRVYRLHWIPLSQAYDVENPFFSPSDSLQDDEEEEEEAYQDENLTQVVKGMSPSALPSPEILNSPFPDENSIRNLFILPSDALQHEEEEEEDETYQDENSSSPCENSMAFTHKKIPSAPPMPECMNSSYPDEEEGMKEEDEEVKSAGERFAEGENQSPPSRILGERNISSLWSEPVASESVNSSLPVEEVISDIRALQLNKENQSPEALCSREEDEVKSDGERLEKGEIQSPPSRILDQRNISSLREAESVNSSLPLEGVMLEIRAIQLNKENQSPEGLCSREVEVVKSGGERVAEGQNQSPPSRIVDQRNISSLWSEPVAAESVNSSLPVEGVMSEIRALQLDKENHSPEVLCSREVLSESENQETPLRRSEGKSSNTPNIWSRRGKPASVLQLQTEKSRGKSVGSGVSVQTETENQKGGKENQISRVLFPPLNEEEEIFTPDKENYSPNTLLVKSLKKARVGGITHSKLCRLSSSKISANSNVDPEEQFFTSDKETQTPMVLKERKAEGIFSHNRTRMETGITDIKRGAERLPFQSSLSNSIRKSRPEVSVPTPTTRSSHSVNCTQAIQKSSNPSSNQSRKEAKKKWNMVVDMTCLLNKESRRSLKLLQGLKGTQLIIPRMVLRELDCLKRCGSFFRKTSAASSVLKWIEECMVKTKWWIHVQRPVEEPRPIAPTPPVTPNLSEASNGGWSTTSVPFSSFGNLTEVLSPTTEDHILDCALSFKKIRNDGQFILLTNDVPLKIKAMAEGLLCETVEEFRESLVNPFSERFLWAESTPRGPTWSHVDDIVLRKNYYKFSNKKSTPKGLKLILLHNSQYGRINSVN